MLIFEISRASRNNNAQMIASQNYDNMPSTAQIPTQFMRKTAAQWPEVSELQAVRHYTQLSQKNFSIDTQFYPLGSCTMKYNPHCCHSNAMLNGFLNRHPYADVTMGQGIMTCLYDLQEMLKNVTGMHAVSLTPAAGAQGEFAGVAMMRAYFDDKKDFARQEILVPDAAHGTNPASAVMCGFKVVEIATQANGEIDLTSLRQKVSPQTAGIMLTNPSTLGVFESQIETIAKIVHQVGGLLYYDGANLNAILGKVRPGDMGFDVIHMNLHKTFSTPHGGGGPGAGPVGVSERLSPYLPIPMVAYDGINYRWLEETECPKSMGRLSTFMGNVGVLLRAYIYARLLGKEGMIRVAEFATLNANYMMVELQKLGFTLAFPERRASHEFIITLKDEAKSVHLSAKVMAKALLDEGFHAPTVYFPLLVAECLLIEPTETEDKTVLDAFIVAMKKIIDLASTESGQEKLQGSPYHLPVRQLDEARAARPKTLNVRYQNTRTMK